MKARLEKGIKDRVKEKRGEINEQTKGGINSVQAAIIIIIIIIMTIHCIHHFQKILALCTHGLEQQ